MFPRDIGAVTLTLTFADNAGNQGTATLDRDRQERAAAGAAHGLERRPRPATGGARSRSSRSSPSRDATRGSSRSSSRRPSRGSSRSDPDREGPEEEGAGHRPPHAQAQARWPRHDPRQAAGQGQARVPTYIVVRETTLKGKRVGKLIKIKFTLRFDGAPVDATREVALSCGAVRILALYDIHGNPDALDAVLADPRAADPDAVVVGGDAVPGAFSAAVLDRLRGAERARCTGCAATASARWRRPSTGRRPPAGDNAAEMSAFTARPSSAPSAPARSATLPLTRTVDGVLFCHATPRSDEELVTRISPPERWSEALAGVDAALVVAGHTHQQDDRMVGRRALRQRRQRGPALRGRRRRALAVDRGRRARAAAHRLRRGRRRPAHARGLRRRWPTRSTRR